MINYDQILDAEQAIQTLKDRYLRQRGWASSSKNPACIWLWSKEINGDVFTTGAETALLLEREL